MLRIIQKTGWLTATLLLLTPVALIFFITIQAALGSVTGQFKNYQNIPQATQLAQLTQWPAGTVGLVQGRLKGSNSSDLLVYQEHPNAEATYQTGSSLVFPEFELALPDGTLPVWPSQTKEQVIQHGLHTLFIANQIRTGFRAGDTVMVMGQWQPPNLVEATGLTSLDKEQYLAEWQADFQKIEWLRNGLGAFTLLGLIILAMQWQLAKPTPPHRKKTHG